MKRIAVFASGSGTNFEAIVRAQQKGELFGEVVLMVCDKPSARVVERAREHGIESFVFSPKDYPSKEAFEREIVSRLQNAKVDLVCLAGYMRIVGKTLLEAYRDRIINIHPALLPSFAGAHGIQDAFDYGVKVFGVTIHYVNEELDAGKIISQRGFEYYGNDVEEVEAKIHQIEHQLYPETINHLLKH